MSESKADRICRQNRERQQAKRDHAHRERVGAELVKVEMYAGTRRDLELMRQVGGYEEADEALTLAIRYMAGLARNNPAAFRAAMDPRNPV